MVITYYFFSFFSYLCKHKNVYYDLPQLIYG